MWLFKIKFVLICHSNNRKFPLSGKNSTVRHMCSILPFLFISYSTSLSFCFLVIGKGLRILGSLAHRGSGGGFCVITYIKCLMYLQDLQGITSPHIHFPIRQGLCLASYTLKSSHLMAAHSPSPCWNITSHTKLSITNHK